MIFLRVSSKVFRRPVGRGGGAGDEGAPRPPAHHAALPTAASLVKLKLLGRTKIVLGSVVTWGQCYVGPRGPWDLSEISKLEWN